MRLLMCAAVSGSWSELMARGGRALITQGPTALFTALEGAERKLSV
jgi:hypothetical protein